MELCIGCVRLESCILQESYLKYGADWNRQGSQLVSKHVGARLTISVINYRSTYLIGENNFAIAA